MVALALLVLVPMCQAQLPPAHLSKNARKVKEALTACPAGSHLHLTLSDGTDQFGDLGNLSAFTFELLAPKTSSPQVLSYDRISRVDCENRITEAGLGLHHRRNSVGLLVIVAIAAGVGVAIIAASKN